MDLLPFRRRASQFFCQGALALAASAQQVPVIGERTAHFAIDVEGEGPEVAAEAKELGQVLEQAWKAFAEVLHGEPAQAKPSQFAVRVCATHASWQDALGAAGLAAPSDVQALYFSPERNVVFVTRQPTRWLTRRLVLHGACQQVHLRAKTKHADLVHTWFVLGLAEQLSTHRWNGQTLELSAHPRVTLTDLPAQAARALQEGLGLRVFDEDNLVRPELSWAVVTFLREGCGGKYRARFDKLALGQTGSKLTGAEFAATLGKLDQVYGELETWLAAAQEPLVAVCGDWEDRHEHELVGRATADDFAFAVVRAPCKQIQARFVRDPQGSGGLVLDFKDKHHYTFAVLGERGVVVQKCAGDQLSTVGEYQGMPTKDGSQQFTARRLGGRVTLLVEDRETANYPCEGEQLGLAVDTGSARFVEVSWK